ncbi:hypothetical protein MASR2M48_35130 [Spirochaetota bacterium]
MKTVGRIDKNNTWSDIKENWINNYKNRFVDNKLSLMKELTANQEWCAEAFLVTDYSVITKETYREFVQKYLAFRLLNNLLDITNIKVDRTINEQEYSLIPLSSSFY